MDSVFNITALHLYSYPAFNTKTVFSPGNFQFYETLERRALTSESYCSALQIQQLLSRA